MAQPQRTDWAPEPAGKNGWRFWGGMLLLALSTMLATALCG